uniref:Tubulin/FtsZ GTPase domain-containing protein n=1 Tax=Mandrillus leucophaeus TaxID=9568 RepID=A0A2K5Z1K6_MANLE
MPVLEIVLTQAGQCGNQIGAKVAGTCPALCCWIWSRAPWTLCARGRTTSSLVSLGPETTGPGDTTQKARS